MGKAASNSGAVRAQGVTVGDKGRVTLSEEIRRHLGIEAGDVVMMEVTEAGTVEIIPAALVPRDQLWFAHPEMQARVAEALDDVAAGRVTTVRSRDELRGHLAKVRGKSRAG